mmetsp:Transcript_2501/g.6779  ORF Transcript_2501/g.6779 Transcript_2501/m.6779 type:complete len:236 (-) Transcript_2501:765-1472(-)
MYKKNEAIHLSYCFCSEMLQWLARRAARRRSSRYRFLMSFGTRPQLSSRAMAAQWLPSRRCTVRRAASSAGLQLEVVRVSISTSVYRARSWPAVRRHSSSRASATQSRGPWRATHARIFSSSSRVNLSSGLFGLLGITLPRVLRSPRESGSVVAALSAFSIAGTTKFFIATRSSADITRCVSITRSARSLTTSFPLSLTEVPVFLLVSLSFVFGLLILPHFLAFTAPARPSAAFI